ncbi:hypothetical protein ERO13_A03G157850v2, partial [Gossypium hirsutum]
ILVTRFSSSVSSPFTLNFFLTINASLETNFFLLSRNARSFSKTWKTRSLICSLLYPLLRMIHYLLMKSLRLYNRRYVCFGMLREKTTLNFMFWNRKHRTLKIGWKLLI